MSFSDFRSRLYTPTFPRPRKAWRHPTTLTMFFFYPFLLPLASPKAILMFSHPASHRSLLSFFPSKIMFLLQSTLAEIFSRGALRIAKISSFFVRVDTHVWVLLKRHAKWPCIASFPGQVFLEVGYSLTLSDLLQYFDAFPLVFSQSIKEMISWQK